MNILCNLPTCFLFNSNEVNQFFNGLLSSERLQCIALYLLYKWDFINDIRSEFKKRRELRFYNQNKDASNFYTLMRLNTILQKRNSP